MNLQGVLRQTTVPVSRRVVPITFSRDFESMLLNSDLPHESLSKDIELAARRGLILLEELLDVTELKDVKRVASLVARTIPLSVTNSQYFPKWHLSIAEDLLDDIDLAVLTHGDDLKELGLNPVDQSKVLVLLAVAACTEKA